MKRKSGKITSVRSIGTFAIIMSLVLMVLNAIAGLPTTQSLALSFLLAFIGAALRIEAAISGAKK